MDSGRRPRPMSSIDGFYRPRTRRPALRRQPNTIHNPTLTARLPRPVTQSINGPTISARQTRPSSINRTLPNNEANNLLGTPSASLPFRSARSSKRLGPKQQRRPRSRRRKVFMSSMSILTILVLIGGWFGWGLLSNIDKVLHGNAFSDVQALFSNVKLKGENQGRVNILLAGDSTDDPGHGGAMLTDSIMVVSIDTKTHTGFMLSVPRDLWVNLPGWGHQKINAANELTKFSQPGYPAGGMGQLEEIVQTDLGIPIDYYALIDYTAFKDAVSAVGGISINIQSSDPRGIYDAYTHLKLPNGWVTLSGEQALNLARARGDNAAGDVSYGLPNSDFDRTMHQRQMIVALEQKATSAGVLTNPIRIGQLFGAFGNNVQTDLNLSDVLRLAQLTKGLNLAKLQSLTYPYGGTDGLLTNYTDPASGEEALIPKAGLDNFGGLQQYYQKLVSNNPITKEAPSVVVLNASDVVRLAHKESQLLQTKGFNVAAIADANNLHRGTMIVDNSSGQKPASRQLLQQLFPGIIVNSASGSTEAAEAQGYTADFVVILGQNWDNSQGN